MIYYCDVCQREYELNRTDLFCIYCGACCRLRESEPEQAE